MSSLPGFLDRKTDSELIWFPEIGVGYYPVKPSDMPYDEAYWDKYREMDSSGTGKALTQERVELVRKYYGGYDIIDVGIGGGRFVTEMKCCGSDVNPFAIRWLIDNHRLKSPDTFRADCMTFWDSLEHIHDPRSILSNAMKYVFISCPIYRDANHVRSSKHFRKDEHFHYWTDAGLIYMMDEWGFEFIEMNRMEEEHGREDIGTFVFRRK